ncbi:MAG: ATP-binding cassette domain-containing protein [Rhodobacteraceae bacterium]|nr:ATP-binding cassette domain-containing protein [Paracoccaceae bacterium]
MSDQLEFDISLRFAGFELEAAAEVPLNGITALSGPSGSGKTTLLRAIAGLEPQAQGHVRFAGEDWNGLAPEARGVGYVFQDARLFPHLDVAGNLDYGARRRGTPRGLVDAVIDALDLGPLLHRAPATLSGGETRRVALGRALASGPRILLMDEPLTGLDRARKSRLMPYIARAVAGFGVPALYVTHSAVEIGFLADRTLSIAEGKLQGWSGAGPRLLGQVTDAVPGQVCLAIGRRAVWLQGHGEVGEIWALPLGQDYLAASEPPGLCNAALTIEALVMQAEHGTGTCDLDVEGQQISIGWHREDGVLPEPGARLWLSLPRLLARPIQVNREAYESNLT